MTSSIIKPNVAGDRKVVARLAGKVGDCPARRQRAQTAATDEVEPKGKNAASRQDKVADWRRNVLSIFNRGEIDGAGGQPVVKGFPRKTCSGQRLEKRFVD